MMGFFDVFDGFTKKHISCFSMEEAMNMRVKLQSHGIKMGDVSKSFDKDYGDVFTFGIVNAQYDQALAILSDSGLL